jgi:hypothetical protein
LSLESSAGGSTIESYDTVVGTGSSLEIKASSIAVEAESLIELNALTISLSGGINCNGNRIFNVGTAITGNDALNKSALIPLEEKTQYMSSAGIGSTVFYNTAFLPGTDSTHFLGNPTWNWARSYVDHQLQREVSPLSSLAGYGQTFVDPVSKNLSYEHDGVVYGVAGKQLKSTYRQAANTTSTIYTDENMAFIWNATNNQMTFQCLTQPGLGGFMDLGQIVITNTAFSPANTTTDLLVNLNTTYYFSDDGAYDGAYSLANWGSRANYWMIPEVDTTYPSYYIQVTVAGIATQLDIVIERIN